MLGWSRFHVAYKRGVTVVRLFDKNLVKEAHVRELACDLLDLIEAGNHRVVLNFQVVERLASWVVVAVEEARTDVRIGGRRSTEDLRTSARTWPSIFPIAGVDVESALHADEAAAIDSPLARGIATACTADRDSVGDHPRGGHSADSRWCAVRGRRASTTSSASRLKPANDSPTPPRP